MQKDKTRRRAGLPGATATGVLVLLLVILCLTECASEQRINSRGSKASSIIEKVNGWRSQRGGSCLSYGHSCWGAHGKRSGKPPITAPDWFLTKLFRRMDDNAEMNRARHGLTANDMNALYQVEGSDDSAANRLGSNNEEVPLELAINRNPEAKPMLDDDLLSKMKIWQIMRESPEEK